MQFCVIKQPINIYSGCADSLGAALTNPTVCPGAKGGLSVITRLNLIKYPDEEAVYQALKERIAIGQERLQLMTDIIIAKLQQHPKLIEAIALRGGVAWLETCEHTVGARNSYREGIGRNSTFIACIIAAPIALTQLQWSSTAAQIMEKFALVLMKRCT